MSPSTPGQIAYASYRAARGGVVYDEHSMPTWDEQLEQHPDIAEAWEGAAQDVLDNVADQSKPLRKCGWCDTQASTIARVVYNGGKPAEAPSCGAHAGNAARWADAASKATVPADE